MSGLTIGTRVQLPGWHCWPAASGQRSYLGALHRHLFGITAEVAVTDIDRQVEFHDLAQVVRDWWGDIDNQRDRGSCEMIATNLADGLRALKFQVVSVRVDEDGESWATYRTLRGER